MKIWRIRYNWKGVAGYWRGESPTSWGAAEKAMLAEGCDPEDNNDVRQWETVRIWGVQEDGTLLEHGAMYTDVKNREETGNCKPNSEDT